jgi:Tol biopolymer transport system component
LAPDGRRVAVTIVTGAGSDIWVIDLARDTRTRFTTGDASASPIWSGDGTRLAFQSYEAGAWSLFWKAVDGTSARQPFLAPVDRSTAIANDTSALLPGTLPTLSGVNPVFPTSWNGPSDTLAFHERKPGGDHDIWVGEPRSEALPFLITPYDERVPRFSPDRRWLAYVSNESGRDEVYVQPFPGPGPKWVISSDGGSDPMWDRAGRELYYRQGDWLMTVPMRLGADFSAGRPRRLFEARLDTSANGSNFDVAPDGQWFLAPRLDGRSQSPSLHLVLNWFAYVRAKTSEQRP